MSKKTAQPMLLSSSLVHELRQPLTVMKGNLQLALAENQPLSIQELKAMLDQVLMVERLVSFYGERKSKTWHEVDLKVIVRQCELLVGGFAKQKGVALTFTVEPIVLYWRADAVLQVLVNLVRNAIQACVGQRERRVHVIVSQLPEGTQLEVIDTGVGLSTKVQSRLGEPFNSTSTKGGGIGLYVCRKLLEEVSGTMSGTSTGERGTRFVVGIPKL